MKRFLYNIIAFIIVIMTIAIASDYVISSGLKRTERGHFYTMNKLMNDRIDADVVVLGNSRAACSYHPSVLDTILKVNTWNLGVSGQPFGVSYLRWQLYRRNNCNPKLLIVNMDYGELNMVSNGFEKEQYYPYMTDTLVKPYLDLYGFSWAEKHIPMYRYRGDYKLMSIGLTELFHIRHDTKGDYIKGYSNQNWKWDGEKLANVLSKGKVRCQCNQQVVKLLEEMLIDAKNEGINVVFVYAPLINQLKENLDEYKSMAEYHRLSEKYEIPILDFSAMDICSDTRFFHDANHVNSVGAQRFSEELAFAIDSLGLLKK